MHQNGFSIDFCLESLTLAPWMKKILRFRSSESTNEVSYEFFTLISRIPVHFSITSPKKQAFIVTFVQKSTSVQEWLPTLPYLVVVDVYYHHGP